MNRSAWPLNAEVEFRPLMTVEDLGQGSASTEGIVQKYSNPFQPSETLLERRSPEVRILADPSLERDQHEVQAEGEFGSLVAMSIFTELLNRRAPFVIGWNKEDIMHAVVSRRVFLARLGSLATISAVAPLAACGGGSAAPPSSARPAPAAPASSAPASGAQPSAKPASSSAAASPAASAKTTTSGTKTTLGVLKSASDAGFYIPIEKGWFAGQGIEIETTQSCRRAQATGSAGRPWDADHGGAGSGRRSLGGVC